MNNTLETQFACDDLNEKYRIFQVCDNFKCENEILKNSNFCWVCNKFPNKIQKVKLNKLFELINLNELELDLNELELDLNDTEYQPKKCHLYKKFLSENLFERTWI